MHAAACHTPDHTHTCSSLPITHLITHTCSLPPVTRLITHTCSLLPVTCLITHTCAHSCPANCHMPDHTRVLTTAHHTPDHTHMLTTARHRPDRTHTCSLPPVTPDHTHVVIAGPSHTHHHTCVLTAGLSHVRHHTCAHLCCCPCRRPSRSGSSLTRRTGSWPCWTSSASSSSAVAVKVSHAPGSPGPLSHVPAGPHRPGHLWS